MIISASDSHPRFRFSLRGLMAVIFGAAVGLTAARQSWVSWHEALLTSVVCWFVIGLVRQILDLRAALNREANISGGLRFGGRLAIAWRVTAILLLVGYCTLEALRRQGLLTLAAQGALVFDVSNQLRGLLFYLAVIVIVASGPQPASQRSAHSLRYRLWQIAVSMPALAACLLVWSKWPMVVYLVHIAIAGIESSFPARFADPTIDLDLLARTKRFVIHSSSAVLFVPLNMWLTGQLAHRWRRSGRILPIVVCLAMSVGVCATYLVWFRLSGLRQFSPHFAGQPVTGPWHLWLSAACLIMFASAVASYQLVSSATDSTEAPQLDWRRNPQRYLHERKVTLLALIAALGGNVVEISQIGSNSNWYGSLDRLFDWPENYIVLAAFYVTLCKLFAGWGRSSSLPIGGQVAVSPWQFGAVWLAMSLTLATAIPLIAWFCFSLWLLFGYRFEWL